MGTHYFVGNFTNPGCVGCQDGYFTGKFPQAAAVWLVCFTTFHSKLYLICRSRNVSLHVKFLLLLIASRVSGSKSPVELYSFSDQWTQDNHFPWSFAYSVHRLRLVVLFYQLLLL
jgi:hypothetical protein